MSIIVVNIYVMLNTKVFVVGIAAKLTSVHLPMERTGKLVKFLNIIHDSRK